MSTTLTPPPLPPVPPVPPVPQASPPPTRSGAARVIAIIAIVIGAVLVLGAIFSAVTSTIASALVHTSSRSVTVAGVTALDTHLSAGELSVVFVEGQTQAELEVTSSSGAEGWTFDVRGDRLVVASPVRFFGPAWWFNSTGRAVLTLPASLEGLDGDFHVSAGDFTTSGEYGRLGVNVSAGRATVSGSADAVNVDISAGAADVTLADVRDADFDVSAGSLTAQLTGTQPDEVRVDVSAGSLSIRVPEGDYLVRSDVSAGGFDSTIVSTAGATSIIDVRLSAGNVSLR